jgi:hypothetical protein
MFFEKHDQRVVRVVWVLFAEMIMKFFEASFEFEENINMVIGVAFIGIHKIFDAIQG